MSTGKLRISILALLAAVAALDAQLVQAQWQPAYVKGDFDGDLYFDLILQRRQPEETSWPAQIWLMNGAVRKAVATLTPQPIQGLRIVGADDFNRDAKTDLVLQKEETGEAEIWLLDGTTRIGSPLAVDGGSPGDTWTLAATGDFNHDGWADLLWQHASGSLQIWLMEGEKPTAVMVPSPSAPNASNWQVAATADFDHGGDLDFVWHNVTSGKAVVWTMDAALVRSTDPLASGFTDPTQPEADAGWRIVAAGQLDGAVALIWQHIAPSIAEAVELPDTDGQIHIWLMGGGGGPGHGYLAALPENQWHTQPSSLPVGYLIVGPR